MVVLLRVGGVADGPCRAAPLVAGGPPAVAFAFAFAVAAAAAALVAAAEEGTGGGPITWSSRTVGRLEETETGCTSVG